MSDAPLNVFEYEQLARHTLSAAALGRIEEGLARGAADERARHVLDSIMIRPRVMSDVSRCSLEVEVAGGRVAMPLLGGGANAVDPTDVAAQRDFVAAAAGAGTVQVVSGTWGPEVDALAADGFLWLQISATGRGSPARQLDRVRHGYRAVVVDLDTGDDESAAGWEVIEQARSASNVPVIARGIVRGDDAVRAVEHGAAGVVVSCLPRVPELITAIDALEEVVDAVGDTGDVYFAGGVRRGIDVFKATALGARACVVDRPLVHAHAVGGERSVADVHRMIRAELSYAMETCGVASTADLTRDLVAVPALAR